MPNFFFDFSDHTGFSRDDTGTECDSLTAAIDQVLTSLPAMACDRIPLDGPYELACEVRDEAGQVVYRAKLTLQGTRDPEGGRDADHDADTFKI